MLTWRDTTADLLWAYVTGGTDGQFRVMVGV